MRFLYGFVVLFTIVGISACENKEKGHGQALVRVNGAEITVLQLNDELHRAGVKAEHQEVATKQLLEKLIDRQLIMEEAKRNNIDRSPNVIQAIERSKVQIITQAYLESLVNQIQKPSKAQIDEYYQLHPEYFAQRKQFDMQQLVISSKDFSNELNRAVDAAVSLDEVELWLNQHNIGYRRGQLSRSITDLPEYLVQKFNGLHKGQLIIINEGDNTILSSITDIMESPVSAESAASQIEQYLNSKKAKEAVEQEIKHLRSSAKIEYLDVAIPSSP